MTSVGNQGGLKSDCTLLWRMKSSVTCYRALCVTECHDCTIVQSDPNYWPSSHPTDGHSNCILVDNNNKMWNCSLKISFKMQFLRSRIFYGLINRVRLTAQSAGVKPHATHHLSPLFAGKLSSTCPWTRLPNVQPNNPDMTGPGAMAASLHNPFPVPR